MRLNIFTQEVFLPPIDRLSSDDNCRGLAGCLGDVRLGV